jgi:hypothetical protein
VEKEKKKRKKKAEDRRGERHASCENVVFQLIIKSVNLIKI